MGLEVAIMQPTYLPWIGYFAMIDRVDQFIYLDSVQFARRSWQQRNRIKSANGELMLTVPVSSKGRRDQLISETSILWASGFAPKHVRAIESAYRQAPFFEAYFGDLKAALLKEQPSLADYTIALIEFLCGAFNIVTLRRRSSDLAAEGHKASLLAALCKKVGATSYLSAPGSQEYIEESDAFERAGISVRYHRYDHPVYPQGKGGFVSYMAAIDLLFHCGGDEGLRVLRQGVGRQSPT
jgi:hypothetical protein